MEWRGLTLIGKEEDILAYIEGEGRAVLNLTIKHRGEVIYFESPDSLIFSVEDLKSHAEEVIRRYLTRINDERRISKI